MREAPIVSITQAHDHDPTPSAALRQNATSVLTAELPRPGGRGVDERMGRRGFGFMANSLSPATGFATLTQSAQFLAWPSHRSP